MRDQKTDDSVFLLKLASGEEELIAAQRLRYRVFVEELGATGPTVDHAGRRERDALDSVVDHLILIDRRRDPATLDHVVGAYRLLRSEVARNGPGFYSAAEFDLSRLVDSGRSLLELGRSCVDPGYRGGRVMMMLWTALADYVRHHAIEIMFGVASYHGTSLEPIARSLSYLYHHHLAPEDCRVRVLNDYYHRLDLLPARTIDRKAAMVQTPALIKGYLRLGGFIGDGAYIDHDFNTVDVCLVLDTARMSARHRDAYTRRSQARR